MDAITCEPMVDQQVLHSDLYEYVASGTTLSAAILLCLFRLSTHHCSPTTTNNTESSVSTLLP